MPLHEWRRQIEDVNSATNDSDPIALCFALQRWNTIVNQPVRVCLFETTAANQHPYSRGLCYYTDIRRRKFL